MSALPKIDAEGEYDALLRFLQLAPIGLAQISLDGQIISINPACARRLTPLTRDGALTNLITALLKRARQALSAAKSGGRIRTVCW